MPQISVIVPVYKVEAYLGRCVDSILAQSFSDFELILVDDGSPDRCGAICDEYAKKDSRIVVIHQKNAGLSAARNTGIDWAFAHSDSQWLTFIDSDDWVHPEYLERLLNAAIENRVSVSICDYVLTEGENPVIAPDELEPARWATESFYVQHNVNATIACAKLYRKECFQSIRYPLGKLHEDEFVTYQILFLFPSVVFIDSPLYLYYVNPNSIIHAGQSRLRDDKYEALEQQIQYFQEHGYLAACRSQVRNYMTKVHTKIQELSKEPQHAEFLNNLKWRKRQHFSSYARLLNPNEDADAYALTQVFPKRMRLYWILRAILRKLRIMK